MNTTTTTTTTTPSPSPSPSLPFFYLRAVVAVLGAAGGIGQPLSLLLSLNPHVAELRLYDMMAFTPGVAADLSHVDGGVASRVRGYTGPTQLTAALTGCDLVVIPAGVPRKPGMTRDDLFQINAGIVQVGTWIGW